MMFFIPISRKGCQMTPNKKGAVPSRPQTASAPGVRKPRKVSDFVNAWIGAAPAQLCPDTEQKDIPGSSAEDILDKDVVVHGYSKRNGSYGDFDLILCSNDDEGKDVFVVTCGGAVVCRKLDTIGAANGFPVRTRFIQPEGKQYFDIV